VADLALYHQIALMQRTFPVRLSRWGESMQQAQARPADPAAWCMFFFPENERVRLKVNYNLINYLKLVPTGERSATGT